MIHAMSPDTSYLPYPSETLIRYALFVFNVNASIPYAIYKGATEVLINCENYMF